MKKVKLIDSTFPGNYSINLSNEMRDAGPTFFQWDREPGDAPLKVFTDIRLLEADPNDPARKVALLVESPGLNGQAIQAAIEEQHRFSHILTHYAPLVHRGGKFVFYPFGGRWIGSTGFATKDKQVSLIVGRKKEMEGHQIRHTIAKEVEGVDLYGEPYTEWMPSKLPALESYQYTIAVENIKADYWFTEKLIDAFLRYTIPIYWGCPSIEKFFNMDGVITFDSPWELPDIVAKLGPDDYVNRAAASVDNYHRALEYACAEDWMHKNLPKEVLNT